MAYSDLIHCHFTKYGLALIFYFTTHDGTLDRILEDHSQFTREEDSKQSTELYQNQDNTSKTLPLEKSDMHNFQIPWFIATFILTSISPVLQAQILNKAEKNYDNGPTVCMSWAWPNPLSIEEQRYYKQPLSKGNQRVSQAKMS
jgi:hypothetical protein